MKVHKYEITSNIITVYRNYNLRLAGIILLVFIGLIILGTEFLFLTMPKGDSAPQSFQWGSLLWPLLPLVFILPFFYAANKKIIIDLNNGDVYQKSWLGKSKLINLKDVSHIAPVGSNTGIYYKLSPRNNPHGKGIRISSYYAPRHRDAENRFRNEVVAPIENRLAENVQATPAPITEYKYYYVESGRYSVIPNWWTWGVSVAILLAVSIYFNFFSTGIETQYKIIPLIPLTIVFIAFSKRIVLDITTQTLTVSYVWLYKKSYSFDKFIQFNIVRHSTNGLYDGTEINMEFDNGKNVKGIEIIKFRKTKHIESFLEETKSILQK